MAENAWLGMRTMSSSIEAGAGVGTAGSDGDWMGPRWRFLEGYRLILDLKGMVTAVGSALAC